MSSFAEQTTTILELQNVGLDEDLAPSYRSSRQEGAKRQSWPGGGFNLGGQIVFAASIFDRHVWQRRYWIRHRGVDDGVWRRNDRLGLFRNVDS